MEISSFGKENISKPFMRDSMMNGIVTTNHVLVCAKFQESLTIDLGETSLGKLQTKTFSLLNPHPSKSVMVVVQKNERSKNGVTVEIGHDCQQQVEIPPSSSVPGLLYWIPNEVCNMREIVTLRMDEKATLQIKVFGSANLDKKAPSVQKSSSSVDEDFMVLGSNATRKSLLASKLSSSKAPNGRKSLIPTANKPQISSAVTVAPTATINVNANVPITTDNSEQWITQQTKTLTKWINQKFRKSSSLLDASTPASGSDTMKTGSVEELDDDNISMNMSMCNESITNDYIQNLKLLLEKDEKEQLFQTGRKLLLSNEIQVVLQNIYKEIDINRLTIRDDRNLHLDIGLQESILELLFYYQEDWLKYGLEVIFNRFINIPPSSATNQQQKGSSEGLDLQRLRRTLRTFIQHNLLSYEITTDMMKMGLAQRDVEKMKKTMICNHIFKRFFELIFFLDQARNQTLLPNRMLFQKKISIHSTKEILIQFCQLVLKGEGDIIKHLNTIGYTVTFQQKYIDEYHYLIDLKQENLFQACKDGVRLARLYEILANQTHSSVSNNNHKKKIEIMDELRVPAGSFLQKKFNLSFVLTKAFGKNHGFDIDGMIEGNTFNNKQTLLMVLWKFMYTYDLNILLSSQTIAQEISRIQGKLDDSDALSPIGDNGVAKSLLVWCQTILNLYLAPSDQNIQLPLNNYEQLLSDGRVLCFIIHYYHPYLFPRNFLISTLLQQSTSPAEEATQKKKLLRYFFNACKNLGGIPNIFYQFSSNTELIKHHYSYTHPNANHAMTLQEVKKEEEKTIILFLSYLFLRLVDSSKQMKAILCIQRAYRRFKQIKYSRRRSSKIASKSASATNTAANSKSASGDDVSPQKASKKGLSVSSRFNTNNPKGTFSPEITVLAPKSAPPQQSTDANLTSDGNIEQLTEDQPNLLVESFDALDLSHLIVENIESLDSYYFTGGASMNRGINPQSTIFETHLNAIANQSISFDLNESEMPLQDLLVTQYKPVASKIDFEVADNLVAEKEGFSEVQESEEEVEPEELDDFDVNLLLHPHIHEEAEEEEEDYDSNVEEEDEENGSENEEEFDEDYEESDEEEDDLEAREEELRREHEALLEKAQFEKEEEERRIAEEEIERLRSEELQRKKKEKEASAATLIQTSFRRFFHRRQFLCVRLVVLIIQSSWRRKLMIRHFLKMQVAALQIMKWYNARKAVKQYCQLKRKLVGAIVLIQRAYLSHRIYQLYKLQKEMMLRNRAEEAILNERCNSLRQKFSQKKIASSWRLHRLRVLKLKTDEENALFEKKISSFNQKHAMKVVRSFVFKSFSQIKLKKLQFQATKVIQKAIRVWLIYLKLKRLLRGVRKLVVRILRAA